MLRLHLPTTIAIQLQRSAFQLRDLKFMLARDAFMDFTCTFDAILQFRAQWRQKLRDGKDSSPLQVCDYSPTEAYLLSN